jgi:hypothetical protein
MIFPRPPAQFLTAIVTLYPEMSSRPARPQASERSASPVWMQPDDEITVEVDLIGRLTNSRRGLRGQVVDFEAGRCKTGPGARIAPSATRCANRRVRAGASRRAPAIHTNSSTWS